MTPARRLADDPQAATDLLRGLLASLDDDSRSSILSRLVDDFVEVLRTRGADHIHHLPLGQLAESARFILTAAHRPAPA